MSGTESLPSSSNLNLEPAVRATPFLQGVQQCFDKAATTYQQGALLQRDVAHDLHQSLLQRLAADADHTAANVGNQQKVLLDLGCGPGWFHVNLSVSCDELIALDLSQAMLNQAKTAGIAKQYIHADAAAIPLAANSVDQVFSSLMLQWCEHPQQVFAEIARVLKPGGIFAVSTLVEESMQEFNQAWQQLGQQAPQLAFLPTATVINAAKAAGLTLHAQQRTYQVFFPDVVSLSREFKQIGANYTEQKPVGLGGKSRWQAFANIYEKNRTVLGLPLSYQVLMLVGTKS